LTLGALHNNLIKKFGGGGATLSRFAWSGHGLTDNPPSSPQKGPSTVVLTIRYTTGAPPSHDNRSSTVVRYESIYTLLHETSHLLNAPDHYCRNDNGSEKCSNLNCYKCYGNGVRPDCLMTYRMEDIETRDRKTIYCKECTGTGFYGIPTHLADHH